MKRLFGRNFNEKFVDDIKEHWPFKIIDDGHGKPLVELELAGKLNIYLRKKLKMGIIVFF